MPRGKKASPSRANAPASNRQGWFSLLALAALVGLGTLAYANSLTGPFVFDDLDEIAENPHIRISSLSWQELSDAAWRSPSAQRPLANVSFALNYYGGRLRTTGFHLVNLVIHLACGALVYWLATLTFERANSQPNQTRTPAATNWMALAAALVFVCHPLQVQAVTYIVQRMTSLATLFYLAALVCYVQGRLRPAPRQRGAWWVAAIVCWLAACGSKEIAVTWPAAVWLYEWYFFQDVSARWAKRSLRWLVPIACALTAAAVWQREALFGTYALRDFTMGERVFTEWRVLVFYLSLFLWPAPGRLSITHDIGVSRGLFSPPTTLLSLALLMGLMVLAARGARRFRLASFGVVWFFLQLALESTVLPLELAYEHRMYLPMVGLALVTAWLLFAYLPHVSWAVATTCGLAFVLAVVTSARNDTWRDARWLWADVVAKYPADARAYNNLGHVLAQRGEYSRALETLQRATSLRPDYAEAHYNIAYTHEIQGQSSLAEAGYRRTIDADSSYAPAYNALGAMLASQGRETEALEYFRRAVELLPDYPIAHNNYAIALASLGNSREAIEHFRRAIEIHPQLADAHLGLGRLLASAGATSDAAAHLQEALALFAAAGNSTLASEAAIALRALQEQNP